MLISIQTHLVYSAASPCDLLLQIEAAQDAEQHDLDAELTIRPSVENSVVKGEEQIGQRRWIRVENEFDCKYSARVQVRRAAVVLGY